MSTAAARPCIEDQSCRCPNCDAARDALAIGLASTLALAKADLATHGVGPAAARETLAATGRRTYKRIAMESRTKWRPTAAEFEDALRRALDLLFPPTA
jgi:uncharacterized membrane protein